MQRKTKEIKKCSSNYSGVTKIRLNLLLERIMASVDARRQVCNIYEKASCFFLLFCSTLLFSSFSFKLESFSHIKGGNEDLARKNSKHTWLRQQNFSREIVIQKERKVPRDPLKERGYKFTVEAAAASSHKVKALFLNQGPLVKQSAKERMAKLSSHSIQFSSTIEEKYWNKLGVWKRGFFPTGKKVLNFSWEGETTEAL